MRNQQNAFRENITYDSRKRRLRRNLGILIPILLCTALLIGVAVLLLNVFPETLFCSYARHLGDFSRAPLGGYATYRGVFLLLLRQVLPLALAVPSVHLFSRRTNGYFLVLLLFLLPIEMEALRVLFPLYLLAGAYPPPATEIAAPSDFVLLTHAVTHLGLLLVCVLYAYRSARLALGSCSGSKPHTLRRKRLSYSLRALLWGVLFVLFEITAYMILG